MTYIELVIPRSSHYSTTTSHSVQNASQFEQRKLVKGQKRVIRNDLLIGEGAGLSRFPFNGAIICMTQTTA